MKVKSMATKNITFTNKVKCAMKNNRFALLFVGVVLAYSLAGTIEFYDEVKSSELNCSIATYAVDNPFKCD